jgi:alpha-glucoside transport system substrate-binding protein
MQIGDTLHQRYTLTARLGSGAMGDVYQATDLTTGQPVAIKILGRQLTLDADLVERFKREGEALRQLRHRHIVSFVDTFQDDGQQVIVMECVSGGSLHQLIKRGPLAVEQARQLAIDLCDALTSAHRLNIIHRDIKPENVLLTADGTPKLTDFGVARLVGEGTRLTGTGMQIGTPYYMSPEAWQGQPLDAQADVWSLGVLLHEMLTGEVPFGGSTLVAVMNKVLTAPLPDLKKLRPETPPALVKIVRRMLERDKAKRYASLRQVAVDLEEVTVAPESIKREPKTQRTAPPAKRRPTLLAAAIAIAGLVLCSVIAAGSAGLWMLSNSAKSAGLTTQTALFAEVRATQTALALALAPTAARVPTLPPASTQPASQPTATGVPTDIASTNTARPQPTRAPTDTALPPATATATTTPTPVPVPPVDSPGPELAAALDGKYRGTTVIIVGTSSDGLKSATGDFEQKTGITIKYEVNPDYTNITALSARLSGNNVPDLVEFNQPNMLTVIAKQGKILDLNRLISPAWLQQNYHRDLLTMGTLPGPNGQIMAGVWYHILGWSYVWYPKSKFEQAGYKVPTTWDELLTLTDQIARDGSTPWCVGMESGTGTGWVMMNWIDDAMLRTTSAENYDKWNAGQLKYDSPEVKKALDAVTQIWFNDKYVFGGRKAIATTSFTNAFEPMFKQPPQCWLYAMGSFAGSMFTSNSAGNKDFDFFYLPPIDPQYGQPMVVSGSLFAAAHDQPPVRAVIQYLTTGASLKNWMRTPGGPLSPHNDASLDWYPDPLTRRTAQTIRGATTLRYLSTSTMPATIGITGFLTQLTAYVNGTVDRDTALKAIDATWPK